MSKKASLVLAAVGVLGFAMICVPGVLADTAGVEAVNILVSPQTILIGGDQAPYVTVHAEIAYDLVDVDASLTLNGIEAAYTFSDDCGDLVAKFPTDEIKDVVSPGMVTMTLCGTTMDGASFSGSCQVRVVVFSGKDKGAGR